MPRLSARFVAFDTETTGTDTESDRICEFGVVRFENRSVVGADCLRMNPGIPIPADASNVHHITDDMVANERRFADVADRVAELLSTPPLVGYNATEYDAPLLNAEFERVDNEARIGVPPVVDPVIFVRWHLRHVRKRQLESLAQRFGIGLEGAHSAVADAEATGKILLAMIEQGLIPDDVDEAVTKQAGLASKIREEFERWTYWLYRDREDGRLRMGAGKHIGTPLTDMDPGYLDWMLSKMTDLPPEVRKEIGRVC